MLNYRTRDAGRKMRPGLCLAIEPMLTAGDPATKVLPDRWTVITVDRSHAAHWEHTVALHEGGLWVLTAQRRRRGRAGRGRLSASPRWTTDHASPGGLTGGRRLDFFGSGLVA